MKSKLKRQSVLDEGGCPNPKQPGPQGAAILVLLSFLTSSIFSPLLSLSSFNELNAKNDASFQAEAQAAASYATNVQSLAKTMLQGGTFQSWVQGQIQDKVNSAMASAIANATGMSPDMAAQLVSWFEKNQAEKKAKAKARTEQITSGLVTVASIMASFVAGPEMMAVGQAVLQAAQGYQNGGMEGALVGAASGAATAYARQFGVNVGVSYSYSGGFGGTLGLGSSKLNAGVTFSQHGSTSFNMGGSYGNVSYNPTSGFSGSVNLTPGQNTGVMVNIAQHSGPSLTVQESNEASGVGGSVTIDGKGNTTIAATYRNATVVSATGNMHDPSSFGNLKANENFNNDLNQNLAMGKADENLKVANAELAAGRNAIAETGNEPQKEILNNENASAADQHGVLATLASAGEFLTDPSSASTWLGRTAQDVVGSFLGSTGLGASDSNGFIDEKGKYVQRYCFTAGTLIRTKEGFKPIEKIELGDEVLSLNAETGKLSYNKVTSLFEKEAPEIYRITYEDGQVINTTWNHPFYIRGKGFVQVKNIQRDARSVTVASIRNSSRIERSSGISIGASMASIGSKATGSNTASWKEEISGTVGIVKIEVIQEKTKVYNFEVEDNHTYFVGKDGVLVHNDDCAAIPVNYRSGEQPIKNGFRLAVTSNGETVRNTYQSDGTKDANGNETFRGPRGESIIRNSEGTYTRVYSDKYGNEFKASLSSNFKSESGLTINRVPLTDAGIVRMDGTTGKMTVSTNGLFERGSNVFVNGMDNKGSDAISSLRLIGEGRTTSLLFNASDGVQQDLENVRSGQNRENSERSQTVLTRNILEGRVGTINSHSQGTIIAGNALIEANRMDPRSIRNIRWGSYGGGHSYRQIPEGMRAGNTNFFMHSDDKVSIRAPLLSGTTQSARDAAARGQGYNVNNNAGRPASQKEAHAFYTYQQSYREFNNQ